MNSEQNEELSWEFKKIKYLKSLVLVIDDMKTLALELKRINEFIISLKELESSVNSQERNEEILDELLYHLCCALAESVYKETSLLLRYIIKSVWGCDFTLSDDFLIDSILKPPNLFKSICVEDGQTGLKDYGEFFSTYTSQYPFNSEICFQNFDQILTKYRRIKPYETCMFWFDKYSSLFDKTMEILLLEDQSIPLTWKYYLAIMAVSTTRCEYLLKDLEMQFLLIGGEESWIALGLKAVPDKLRKMDKINNILAHQPWKLNVQDINDIFHKYDVKGWNLNQLTQASLILTFFQRLASIVKSLKISIKISNMSNNSPEEDTSTILKFSFSNSEEHAQIKKKIISELEDLNNSEEKKTNNLSKNETCFVQRRNSFITDNFTNAPFPAFFTKHISSFCTVHQDFDNHAEETHSYIEFNWQDSGSYILKNYHSTGIDAINNEIDFITNLTSNNIGGDSKILDTTFYRQTIITYVETIMGMYNESYDYSKTNKLLHRMHKQFLKNICCFPERITKLDCEMMRLTFTEEEIFHIILIVTIVKMRLQLTYLAKNINEIIKSID